MNLVLNQGDYDIARVAFPGGGLVPSVDEFTEEGAQAAAFLMSHAVSRRIDAASSGAMRWPWSQEYPLFRLVEVLDYGPR